MGELGLGLPINNSAPVFLVQNNICYWLLTTVRGLPCYVSACVIIAAHICNRFPFHAFHWWRAYHVRLTKSNCLPRISVRGRQCIIHRWITKKIMCAITWTRDLWTAGENCECFELKIDLFYPIKFNVFLKINKIFQVFCTKFALFLRFFDSWYIIKYLLTETSGKQYVLWTLDCRCSTSNIDSLGSTKHTVSLGLGQ